MALKLKVESEQTCVPLLHEPVEGRPTEPHQLLWRDEVWMLIVIGFPVGMSSFCRMLSEYIVSYLISLQLIA